MSKFNTTKQKLRKVWENIFKNSNDLKNLDNNSQVNFFPKLSSNQISKNIIQIADTDITPAILGNPDISIKTINRGTLLPIEYLYEFAIDLNLTENFLPFIKIVTEAKTVPNTEIALGKKITVNEYSNDTILIKGDDSLLFQGNPNKINVSQSRTNTLLSFFNSDELTTFKVPLSLTKKVFKATIEWNDGTNTWKIEGPMLRFVAIYDVGTGCDGNIDRDVYDCLSFKDTFFASERADNEFLNFSSSTFSIKAQFLERRWVASPTCGEDVTITDGITKTASFSGTSEYQITVLGALYKKVSGNFILQGNNQVKTIESNFHTILSKAFEDIGFRAYYSTLTQAILSVIDTGQDGSFDKFELNDLPNEAEGQTLPYTSFDFLRNPDPFPNEITTENKIINTNKIYKNFLKINDSKYKLILKGQFLSMAPAIINDPNTIEFPVYNDTYTITTGQYEATTVNHSISSKITYVPEQQDATVRIRVYLQNPLYWKEQKQYDL